MKTILSPTATPPHQIRLIISDLDGTLVDTNHANILAYRKAFADLGVELTDAHALAMNAMHVTDMIELVAPHLTTKQRDLVRQLKSQCYPEYFHLLHTNDSLITWLRVMKTQDLSIALASTASRINGIKVLKACDLLELFDHLVFGDDVVAGKPDPECFQQCMDWAEVRPDQTLIIEDSPIGHAAATQTGASVIMLSKPWGIQV